MKLRIFAVHDSKAELFMQPFFSGTRGQAIRSFSDAVADPEHQFAKHAEDFTLFEIGEYDQLTGVLTSSIHSLGLALTYKRNGGQ